jgi:hypothetical protein
MFNFLSRLFTKSPPPVADLGRFGRAIKGRFDFWSLATPVHLGSHTLPLDIRCKDRVPAAPEIELLEHLVRIWPAAWESIVAVAHHDLEEDGPGGDRERFLREARAVGILLDDGLEEWEVIMEPEICAAHTMTMEMKADNCVNLRLDG